MSTNWGERERAPTLLMSMRSCTCVHVRLPDCACAKSLASAKTQLPDPYPSSHQERLRAGYGSAPDPSSSCLRCSTQKKTATWLLYRSAGRCSARPTMPNISVVMKGTKVQTLGARAVAGAWCMAGRLIAI